MLGPLDETLLHQAAVPFSQTTVSDHRFFDRVWFGGHSADRTHFLAGMGAYKNTNTLDGFFTVLHEGRQHNIRVSRPFLDDPDSMAAGPISVEIVKPYEQMRLTAREQAGMPFSAELLFTATVPVSLEAPHFSRVDGRVTQDYQRFDQLGRIDGWIDLGGKRISADGWFGARDHSWGVRPGMGGYDAMSALPRPGENPHDVGQGHEGFLVIVLWFDLPGVAGYLMLMENGRGERLYSHGKIVNKAGGDFRTSDAARIDHQLQFMEGTRSCSHGRITVVTVDGETIEIDVESLGTPLCYLGTGYDGGFNDGRGLGFHRGNVLECDVFGLAHAEDVVLPDGRTIRPWHREGGARVRIDGEEGLAHFPVISSGFIEKYRLADSGQRGCMPSSSAGRERGEHAK